MLSLNEPLQQEVCINSVPQVKINLVSLAKSIMSAAFLQDQLLSPALPHVRSRIKSKMVYLSKMKYFLFKGVMVITSLL